MGKGEKSSLHFIEVLLRRASPSRKEKDFLNLETRLKQAKGLSSSHPSQSSSSSSPTLLPPSPPPPTPWLNIRPSEKTCTTPSQPEQHHIFHENGKYTEISIPTPNPISQSVFHALVIQFWYIHRNDDETPGNVNTNVCNPEVHTTHTW